MQLLARQYHAALRLAASGVGAAAHPEGGSPPEISLPAAQRRAAAAAARQETLRETRWSATSVCASPRPVRGVARRLHSVGGADRARLESVRDPPDGFSLLSRGRATPGAAGFQNCSEARMLWIEWWSPTVGTKTLEAYIQIRTSSTRRPFSTFCGRAGLPRSREPMGSTTRVVAPRNSRARGPAVLHAELLEELEW